MPTLDIADEEGNLRQLAPVIVASVMFSPSNAELRDQIIATGFTDTAIKVDVPIPPEIASVTHRGPGTGRIEHKAGLLGYEGWLAGQLLLFILRCATHQPEHASVRKGVRVIARALVREEKAQRRPFASSESKILEAWKRFKPVSHLWAALHILGKSEDGLNAENLVELLSTAEFLRKQGEAHFSPPRRNKAEPLLKPGDAWVTPRRLELRPVAFAPPNLFPHELDWLKGYRVKEL
jgi:hypothetical protein